MNEPIHARLTKLSTLPGAEIDPLGARENGPIQDGYFVKGYYFDAPTIGQLFRMMRYESNGEKAFGIFMTSSVETAFQERGIITFKTRNSTYQITPIYGKS